MFLDLKLWLRLHPYHINQKIEIIIEHFKQHIADLLNGQAKAMIVTSSRKEAFRYYKLAFYQYIQSHNYANIQAMVAFIKRRNDLFSGEISEDDLLTYTKTIKTQIKENNEVMAQLKDNSK